MRVIEPFDFLTARNLQARYGVSRMWLERHCKNHGFPQPIMCAGRVGAVRHWRRSIVLACEIQWEQRSVDDLIAQSKRNAAS